MEGFLNKVSRESRSIKMQNGRKHNSDRSRDHSKSGYSRKDRSSWKKQVRY